MVSQVAEPHGIGQERPATGEDVQAGTRTTPEVGPGAAVARTWAEAVPIGDLPVRAAALWPDAEGLVLPGVRLTYRELADEALTTARALRALGVGPGDHVGVLMANSPDFVTTMHGTTMLGAVAVLVNARYQGDDLAHVMTDAGLKVLVTGDQAGQPFGLTDRVEAALPDLDPGRPDALPVASAPDLGHVVVLGEATEVAPAYLDRDRFRSLAARVPVADVERLRRGVPIRSTGLMMYTSGTTSKPKGCRLSHEMVVRNGVAAGERLDIRRGDRFWDPLPMFHMSAVLPMTACFHTGATFISMSHFEADPAMELMAQERVTHAFPTFPMITQAIANHPRFDEVDFSALRLVNNVAPPARLRELQQLWPHASIVTAYGSTETGGVVAFSSLDDTLEQRTSTCGVPFPGIEVRILDAETGTEAPVGERGEICVRGYSLFEGYHDNPEQTAAAVDDDGWFHTGDIGMVDVDGRVSYLGRLKDMLKVGGENVAAIEIEETLEQHPAVNIAQVVGIPDDRYVEVPAAFVELVAGRHATPEELGEWLVGRLANFKLPRHVRVVEEWPVAATKIQKFRLREQLCAELGIAHE